MMHYLPKFRHVCDLVSFFKASFKHLDSLQTSYLKESEVIHNNFHTHKRNVTLLVEQVVNQER